MNNAYDYILVMLLQRIDSIQNGTISELISGVEADSQSIQSSEKMTDEIRKTIEHSLSILRLAQQGSSADK